jgi:intracellular sulfur oxidation DsrE/DsrF family protein
MKKSVLSAFAVLLAFNICAQTKPVKIVFDVTSADPATHQSTMRHVKSMASNYPDSDFEVVLYSGSIDMVLKEKSTVADEIISFAGNDHVSFKVCAMTLKRKEIDKSELLVNVEVIPDGILEIVTRQSEGWGYIKESNH